MSTKPINPHPETSIVDEIGFSIPREHSWAPGCEQEGGRQKALETASVGWKSAAAVSLTHPQPMILGMMRFPPQAHFGMRTWQWLTPLGFVLLNEWQVRGCPQRSSLSDQAPHASLMPIMTVLRLKSSRVSFRLLNIKLAKSCRVTQRCVKLSVLLFQLPTATPVLSMQATDLDCILGTWYYTSYRGLYSFAPQKRCPSIKIEYLP